MPITDDDRQKLISIFDKIKSEMKGDWLQRIPDGTEPQSALNLVALENFHRVALETLFNECLPYDDVFVAELAVRQAAYTITALPFTTQEKWTDQICQTIPVSVKRKVSNGHVIRTHWNTP